MLPLKTVTSSPVTFVIGLLVMFFQPVYAQVNGCTDPLANNFNSLATVNDGSCTYSPTNYQPLVKVNPISDELIETSGLQMAGNFLWSFNDSGGEPAIYRLDTITGFILQKVILQNATNLDWEDIAFDGASFYIGDFGNNLNGARTDLKIYKFPFRAIPDYVNYPVTTIAATQIEIINFTYSDQPQPPVTATSNNTKFDCEAMIADGGKIHLFTKNWVDINTTHYEINGVTAGTYIATPQETLVTNYLVTAADKAYGQNIIVLLGYDKSFPYTHHFNLLTSYNGSTYFSGNKRKIDLPNAGTMGQGEGICFRTGTYGYISNEKINFPAISQKLHSFNISNFISNAAPVYTFNGTGNWSQPSNWSNNTAPPATIVSGSEIIIDPLQGGQCILNIPYTIPAGVRLIITVAKDFVVQGNLTIQ